MTLDDLEVKLLSVIISEFRVISQICHQIVDIFAKY